ncbi:Dehydrin COR47-like protein [Drosera capensis]
MADQEYNHGHHRHHHGHHHHDHHLEVNLEVDELVKFEETNDVTVEETNRGLFGFGKKKEEEDLKVSEEEQEVIVEGLENVKIGKDEEKVECVEEEKAAKVEEVKEKKKKHSGILEKLHHDSSSSSSDEEDEEKKKKKKEKKSLKDKIKEKLPGHKEEEKHDEAVKVVAVAEASDDKVVIEEVVYTEPSYPEEKKGFLEKIKDKLPGHNKKAEEVAPPLPPPVVAVEASASEYVAVAEAEPEVKEKKGFLEKIKEKIPGFHKHEEEKERKEVIKEVEGSSAY